MTWPKTWKRDILFILGIALIVRLAIVTVFPEREWHDAYQYHLLAKNILSGNGFSLSEEAPFVPTMYREPLYPMFIATVYMFAGISTNGHGLVVPSAITKSVYGVQIVLSSITCVFVYLIAYASYKNYTIARLSGMLAAVHGVLAVQSGFFLVESLTAFFVAIGIYYFVIAHSTHESWHYLVAGLFLGLATLCRGSLLLMPLFLIVLLALWQIKLGNLSSISTRLNFIRSTMLVIVSFILVLLPWMLRNKLIFDTFSLTVRSGMVMWARTMSLEAGYDRAYTMMYQRFDSLKETGLNESQADGVMMNEAITKIKDQPLAYLAGHPREVRKLWLTTYSERFHVDRPLREYINNGNQLMVLVKIALGFIFLGLLLLMLIGIGTSWSVNGYWIIPLGTILYITFIHSLFAFSGPRYVGAVLPMTLIFSARGLVIFWDQAQKLSIRSTT